MKDRKDYDYYIFIDYSENLVGYNIIKQKRIFELLPKISKFQHYREQRNKSVYLGHIKYTINKENILCFFEKLKILQARNNLELFSEVSGFVEKHRNCAIFLCIDDYQFKKFKRLLSRVNGKYMEIKKESQLKKGTPEYKTSLVIDNLLNIERRKFK